ncbi:MAG TPA: phenylalanine--tRNA ligase beta subunit-related protein [Thermodesulfobacteriota bacterium]|jgi:DNA/RNA-binding domain of Phe-tRNA-synthetase-like protein|nr:phenylalanine--tRNA ligase beta subunit-related protein [Thermodesulfobacteriota bacterium]
MLFSIQKDLFNILPDLTIGMLAARDVDNTHPSKEIDDLLNQAIEEVKKNFVGDKAQDHPRIKPWRTAFSKLGISGSKFPSSIESMARRILKGDPFPKINPLVDLYNSVSLRFLVPMGGHDLDTIEGNIHLQFAEGWEPFSPMGGGETTNVPKGELVYRDDREVLTRNWVWRQCEKDKATEKTKNIFIPIDVLGEVGRERADEIILELSRLIPKYLRGTLFSAVLDSKNPSVEF